MPLDTALPPDWRDGHFVLRIEGADGPQVIGLAKGEAYDLTRRTIFVGLGADQYRTISAHDTPVHNTYLLLLAEGVLMSLIGHVGLIITGIVIGWPNFVSRSNRWYGVLTITIEGELGLLVAYGDQPEFVLSVGGFHPSFRPPPLPFPVPKRISIEPESM